MWIFAMPFLRREGLVWGAPVGDHGQSDLRRSSLPYSRSAGIAACSGRTSGVRYSVGKYRSSLSLLVVCDHFPDPTLPSAIQTALNCEEIIELNEVWS